LADPTTHRNPLHFFLLTFLISWGIWLPSILVGLGVDLPINAEVYTSITVIIGAFAPMISAVVLVAGRHGWKEAWRFIKEAFNLKVKPVYMASAIVIPLVLHAIVHYSARLIGLDVADTLFPKEMSLTPIMIAIPYFFLMLLIGGGQEEFGWRGYALDPLQNRMGVIPASLLIGLVWGMWHWPLWVMPGDGHSTYPFLAFVVMTTSISVVYSWLYNASGKKLITPILFHAMSNTAAPLLPFLHLIPEKPETAYWVYAAGNILIAVMVGWMMQKQSRNNLSSET